MPTKNTTTSSLPGRKGEKGKYMLVDGNALIHRGYHAMPNLSTKTGEPTGATYGFSLILLRAIADIKPTHIAVTFDLAAPTFRHLAYAEYKAHRVKADQELYDQIPRVKEVVRALNIPIFEMAGFEADDLLGTLATDICKRCKSDCEVFIVTGDLDTLQLVNDCVKVYTLRKGLTDTLIYDEKAVRERYGLNPNQMVDFRALKGDPSDNIAGVKGIGEKIAAELIKHFGSIEKLYKELRQAAKKQGAKFPISNFQFSNKFQIFNFKTRVLDLLINQEDAARKSYMLSEIKIDVPIEIHLPKYQFAKENFETAFKLFQDLEFKSLISKLPKTYGSTITPERFIIAGADTLSASSDSASPPEGEKNNVLRAIGEQKYQLVDTLEMLEKAVKDLSRQNELSVDTESNSLSAVEADLVGLGLCCNQGSAFYIPAQIVKQSGLIKKLLESDVKKIGHNLKYDLLVLQNAGINLKNLSFDTMIASYLLNPGTRQHNLSSLAFSELGYHMQPIEELIGKGKKQITMDRVDVEKVSRYCCEDVDMAIRLKTLYAPQLRREKLDKIFYDIEMPLVEVLAAMERQGILLDSGLLNRLAGEAEVEIKQLETEIHKLTGEEFNVNSPKQLKEVLFDKLGLVPVDNKKTKTGLSTAAGELEKMLGQHPVIEKLLEYRELAKLYSTYLLALPALVSKKTARLHTSFNQTVTATGRLSSSDPNLQNIPVRGAGLGSKIRQGFVAEHGYKLLSLDYSQIELRIVAHLAQDQKMLEVFKRGEDIHTMTAMEIFGVPKEQVTKDMRRDAKTINFGILYGLSSFGLSSRIGQVSRAEAKEFIGKYFAAYPRIQDYIDNIVKIAHDQGFVANELGRIRRFPEIYARQWAVRAAAERAAINFPIQSLAADVIKVAMINIYKELKGKEQEIRMLLQVHDELVFEVREGKEREWAKILIPMMEGAIKLSVPVRVEGKVGKNWGEMEKIEL
ncbi:MAG: DNA polymerase I [Patescibacteria group bacterium]|nr:DNA polymerase I [Patescibacteria group bacterium]